MTSLHHRSHATRRAGPFGAALLGAALVLAPVTTAAADPAAQDEPITDLGIAMQAPNVRLSDVGALPDGTPVAYLFSDGEPVSFNVVDLRTGDLLDSHEIAPYSVASSIDVADDGTVYLSVRSPNDGTLWRYDPGAEELEQVATGIAGEQMLRMLDIEGGTLYGTTYPNAEVYAMDLETEEITEFGSVTEEGDYAWGLDAAGDTVWVGAGTPAQLYTLAPTTGEITSVELPADVVADGGFIQRVETYGDITVFSHRAVDGATMSVHDGTDWVGRVAVGGMWLYTEQHADGSFYYLDSSAQLHAYDVSARSSSPVDVSGSGVDGETSGTTRMFLAELGTEDFPGTTVVGTRTDGMVWRYNLDTGEGDVLRPDAFGSPVTIMSIAEGGDGQVYVGAYLSPGIMARIDPGTGEIEQLDGPEQADSIVAHGTRTVIGTYPNAEFYAAEAGEPWAWGQNPGHLFTLGRSETGQDRPRHMAAAGDLVAAGTIPNYGELGGALTLFDPATGEHEVHRNVVQDQSVTDLTYLDGVVYGGTSIHGGLDSTPTQQTAELFVWDLDDGLVTSAPVVEGAEVIHALTVDADGQVWGMADTGTLFAYDTETNEVARTVDTGIEHGNIWGTQSELGLNPADGLVYGNAGGRLFRFDPAAPEIEVLVRSGVQRATVAAGDVYFTDETNVYRYELEDLEEPGEPEEPGQRYGFFLTNGWGGGDADHAFMYGRHTDQVLIGDWDGDGTDSITVRRGDRYFVNNHPTGGPAQSVFQYGRADDTVLVGDWDGDGIDTLAVRRGATYHVKNSLRGGDADVVLTYGRADDEVLVGDWDGDGIDTVAVRRQATYHVKNTLRGGDADVVLTYGRADDQVLAGDWDGDGRDTFTVRRGKEYHMKNSLAGGPADVVMKYGHADDEVYVGDWDGDGRDTIGVRRTPQTAD